MREIRARFFTITLILVGIGIVMVYSSSAIYAAKTYGDPTLFERQPQAVWDDCRPPSVYFGTRQRDRRNLAMCMARNRDCYFHRREAMALGNYFVWEHDRYTYPWIIDGVDPDTEERARLEAGVNKRKLGWPDHYFNKNLWEPVEVTMR